MGSVFPLVHRLEQRGAQRRRQAHGHQHRQHHGRHHRDAELAVNHACGAAKEGHGDEHRTQHDGNADQRTADLLHALLGGFTRTQAFFSHQTFDVFHHHNGVVHQQTDSQHQTEHGEGVDRKTRHRQHAHRAQHHHGNGNGRNQRGAKVLHEQIHDRHHQHHGFEQCLHNALDRHAHEGRGVISHCGFETGRQKRLQFLQLGFDGVAGGQRIGATGREDGHARRTAAVAADVGGVAVATQFHTRHVAQAQRGPIRLHA